jgi:hypothetical protein
MKPTLEKYKGIDMPVPQTGEVAIIKMNAEKSLYEKYFKNKDIARMNKIKIYYEYDRQKAIELGADISQFPEQLNYLENKN